MASTLIVLNTSLEEDLRTHLGHQAALLAQCMLSDTVAVARQLVGVRVVVADATVPLHGERGHRSAEGGSALVVRSALATALADGGPAVVIGGDLPHLPVTRLRDAFTRLEAGAAAVLGPSDDGRWYLVGLGVGQLAALKAMPGYAERPDRLIAALGRHAVHLLPPWFAVRNLNDLAALSAGLQTLPPTIAAQTRQFILGDGHARAVGG